MQEFTGDDLAGLLGDADESSVVSEIDDLDAMLAGAESLPETARETANAVPNNGHRLQARNNAVVTRKPDTAGHSNQPTQDWSKSVRPQPPKQSFAEDDCDVVMVTTEPVRPGAPQNSTPSRAPEPAPAADPSDGSPANEMKDDESRKLTAAYLNALDVARAKLRKLQKPRDEPVDRSLQRLQSRLESLTVKDVKEVVSIIDKMGQTGQLAAVPSISDWAGRQNRHISLACARAASCIDSCRAGLILLGFIGKKNVEAEQVAVAGLLRWHSGVILTELLRMTSFRREWVAVLGRAAADLPDADQATLLHRLKRLLKSEDPRIVSLAIAIASRMKTHPTLDDFARLMKRSDPAIRVAALQGMAQLGEKKAVRLVNAAMSDPVPSVRAQAAINLQGMQSTRSFELLLKGVVDPDVQVRRNSAAALSHSQASDQIDALVSVIRQETDVEVIGELLLVVGQQAGPAALKLIEQYLDCDNAVLRKQSARALRKTTARAAAPLFLKMLASHESLQRRTAIEGLARLKYMPAGKHLRNLLQEDEEVECRAAAAKALGQLGDASALSALEEAAADADLVRCQAVIATGHLKEPSAIPFLAAQLKLASPEVKYHCCSALAELNAVKSAHLIQDLLMDPDPMVQRGAKAALEKMGMRASGPNAFRRIGMSIRSTVAAVAPGGIDISAKQLGIFGGAVAVVLLAVTAFLMLSGSGGPGGPIPVGSIRDLAVSSDGTQVSVLRSFGVVEIWDSKNNKLLHRAQNSNPGVNRIFFSGSSVVMLSNSTSELWDPQADPECRGPKSLSISAQVEVIARAGQSGPVYLVDRGGRALAFNVSSGQQQRTVQTPFRGGSVADISTDGTTMVTCNRKGNITLFDLEKAKVREELLVARLPDAKPNDYVTSAALSLDGTKLAIGLRSGPVIVLDTAGRQLLAQLQRDATIASQHLDFDARDGLTVFGGTGSVTKYDKNLKQIATAKAKLRSPLRYCASADVNLFAYFEEDTDRFYLLSREDDAATVVAPNG